MKFFIAVNESITAGEANGSVTFDVVDTGSDVARTNKRLLRAYFKARGVLAAEMKSVFKAMNFTHDRLGR